MTLIHGGRVADAARVFGIPRDQWLDISTGISPWSWPAPPVPQAVWQRLPETDGQLEAAATTFYGCSPSNLLPVPGSQYGISKIPHLLPAGKVALPLWGYDEHRLAWQRAGHEAIAYASTRHLQALVEGRDIGHAVVINPSNPTAEMIPRPLLMHLADTLCQRNGYLLVDEAFMDATPEHSLISERPEGVIVLRSAGKFFGLAGIRLGFVVTDRQVLARLDRTMDPWAVSHPARWLGTTALSDSDWHRLQRRRLAEASQHWHESLTALFPNTPLTATSLFVTMACRWQWGEALFNAAARLGLLIRLIGPVNNEAKLRFGLPPPDCREEILARLWRASTSLNLSCGTATP
jgi:cobalamin biosynthesis protein CobC